MTTEELLDELTEIRPGLSLYHNHSLMQWEAFYAGKFFEYNYPDGNNGEIHWETLSATPQEALQKLYNIMLGEGGQDNG